MNFKHRRKLIFGDFISASPGEMEATWHKKIVHSVIKAHPVVYRERRIKIGLAIAVLSALTSGCVGFVGGGYGGGVVVAPAPDVVLFGGTYDRGGDVHSYSQRGSESRAAAHAGGGGHGGGGGERR